MGLVFAKIDSTVAEDVGIYRRYVTFSATLQSSFGLHSIALVDTTFGVSFEGEFLR